MIFWDELLKDVPAGWVISASEVGAQRTMVSGIALDSRKLRPGEVFVALSGGSADGHRFIPAAIKQGAAAVVGEQPMHGLSVPYLQVSDSRQALAHLSAAFYGFPARHLTVIGVTGTDGKTTTCNLIYQILKAAGLPAGMISTVNAVIGDQVLDTGFHVTTPEAPDIQGYLAQMVAAGLTHVVLESTSHGLAQQRVAACDFDIGVVTNITHEHLDYHGSIEAYRAAKARLLASLAETPTKDRGNPRLAVLNAEDSSYDYLREEVGRLRIARRMGGEGVRIAAYGLRPGVDMRAVEVAYSARGLRFKASWGSGYQEVSSSLLGEYNIHNCLAALAATILGLGIEGRQAAEGIAAMPPIPGRMEAIRMGQDYLAIVDFAHTPNALREALGVARQLVPGDGKLIAVFGSAGLRDRAKRRLMARAAAELADFTLLTAEDPRTESLDAILAEMADEMRACGGQEGRTFWRVADRGEALRRAVRMAHPGDLLIALGKGHEQTMCFGEIEYPWDDRLALQAALAESLGVPGPDMPRLPTSV